MDAGQGSRAATIPERGAEGAQHEYAIDLYEDPLRGPPGIVMSDVRQRLLEERRGGDDRPEWPDVPSRMRDGDPSISGCVERDAMPTW